MNYLKKNIKLIIGFILVAILSSGITVFATNLVAGDVSYTRSGTDVNNVAGALDNLYSIKTQLDGLNANLALTNATTSDIATGKKAYSNGNLLTGTAVFGDGFKTNITVPTNHTRRYI